MFVFRNDSGSRMLRWYGMRATFADRGRRFFTPSCVVCGRAFADATGAMDGIYDELRRIAGERSS